ncbi:response regulator [Dehalococcoidia bacterium]|nr:response regulator [Dehalococcoidia bacterium]
MRVLVVGDEIEIGKLLQRELERQGCEAEYSTTAADVPPRLSETAGEPCEVLLLNLDIPEMGGFELLKEIRETRLDLDVIVIIADGDEDKAIEAIRLGAIDHLRKPISLEELRTVLFRVRQRRAAAGKEAFKQRILVVDDEEDLAARMKQELEREGYEVAVAYDGLQGLEYFRNNHVDAVIADIRMPGIDGLEMLDQCRAINPDFVPIIITGFGDHEKAIRSLKLGVFDYLRKPISLEELIGVVGKGLDLVALRRGLSARQRELEIESALKMRYAEKLEREKEAVEKSEEKYRSILQNIEEGYYEIDIAGYFRFFNDSLCKILGYSRDELMRMNNRQNTDEENARKVYQTYNEVYLTGETVKAFDWEIIRKDGSRRHVESSISLISSPTGQPTGFRGILRDITERKQAEAERRQLEQEVQMASRLASVGEMASGIAHEINNPLTSVIGFAQLLMQRDIADDIKQDLKIINDSAQRVADIVRRLLDFARRREPERNYVNINDIVEATLAMRAYEMETGNIKLATLLDPDLPRTVADGGQLQQIFLNIIMNAETEMKLARGRGNLLIQTGVVDDTIRISFEDDGPGITRENLDRIFDPFFTTRGMSGGTGLGLSLCHAIVAQHNGRIYAKSTPGKGATFVVELPIVIEDEQLELPEPIADEAKRSA